MLHHGNQKEVIFRCSGECNNTTPFARWEPCIVSLTKRYLELISADGIKVLEHIPIPQIVSVKLSPDGANRKFCLLINFNNTSLHINIMDENNYRIFESYLFDIMKTSAQVRNQMQDMLFAQTNMDEGTIDTLFVDILTSVSQCKTSANIKHLLTRVKDYLNETDPSILILQKPYYLNFVECLRYMPEELVTPEVMNYASDLIHFFDDNVDDPLAATELRPTPVDLNRVVKVLRVNGRGKYGIVYEAVLLGSNRRVALKRLEKNRLSSDSVKIIMREAAIMYRLRRHPHIVGLQYFWEDSSNFYLVMDYVPGGELFNAIVDAHSFSEAQAQRCVMTLLYTLHYCHQRGIVHRDLKPENIMLKEPHNLDSICLTDFGLANELTINNALKSYCGTPGYMAPEVITSQLYGPSVDMWSLGVITYILLCGYHPFPQNNDKRMNYNITHGIFSFDQEVWNDKSDDAKDFITRLLCVDPRNRMDAQQAISHRWMMFASKSTMNMNRAVQELDRYNIWTKAHARNPSEAAQCGIRIVNYISLADCLVYTNPTTSQQPLFSLPRQSVLSCDQMINAADGVWIHVYDPNGAPTRPTDPSGKWVLAGRINDNPICVPVGCAVYMSRFKKGKAFHLVKKSPACDEPQREQIPGGLAVIVDRVLTNDEGTWLEVNQQTLYQFKVTMSPPVYLCAVLRERSVLFDKMYGD